MPANELTLEQLRTGEVNVLGRIPWGSNATLLAEVETDNGCHRAIYKPRRGERPLWDFPQGLDLREVAAYELSEALGWGIVPATVLREDLPFGIGSLQRFVPFAEEEHYFTLYEDPAHHSTLRQICCFDLLSNQTDRKSGHCLLGDDGRIWAVDNGLAFHVIDKLRTVIWDFGGESIADDLLSDIKRLADEGVPQSLTELLDRDEVEAIVRRAERLMAVPTFPLDRDGNRYPWPLV